MARRLLLIANLALSGFFLSMTAAEALPENFQDQIIWSGFEAPTVISFAPNGKVFIAEKTGIIKVFDNLQDTTPTVFADLSNEIHEYSDRGLLGLVVDPQFPARPYVYVLYTMDAPLGSTPPSYDDECPIPDICPVGSRLSKLTASGNTMTSEQVLLESWCQVENSHSVGMLFFGTDGALYVSHGDGASYNYVDYGQDGGCNDPVNEGGALRSQDLRTSGDTAVSYDGALLRLDPDTGAAFAGNPLAGGANTEDDRIISYGFRNPFRFSIDPTNGTLWVADVGWNNWEEVDRIPSPTGAVLNFGWPCYEGASRQDGYDAANIPICEALYTAGVAQSPYYTYSHNGASGAISAIALYRGNNFPAAYNGALFFGDYTRGWIRMMPPGANGLPNAAAITDFIPTGAYPVDLKVGPNGALYYADIVSGSIHQISYFTLNTPPTAQATASPVSGPLQLVVHFDGSGSFDPDAGDTLNFEWDLDGDGAFDDSMAVTPIYNYTQPQTVAAKLRVTDSQGATSIATVTIYAGNSAPTANIITPTTSTLFNVGEEIFFSGDATDPDTALFPVSALKWDVLLHHCALNDPNECHVHSIQSFNGVAGGFIVTPDHEYPARLEFRLTATDPANSSLTNTTSVIIQPRTTTWTFTSDPSGLQLAAYGSAMTTPFTRTAIVNAQSTISAPVLQQLNNSAYEFLSWSDAGASTHTVTATAAPQTFNAIYAPSTAPSVWHSWEVMTQAGSPQAVAVSNTNITAPVEFYESTNDLGITKGSLFSSFTNSAHQETFNNLTTFWSTIAGTDAYPYAGKSTINRGSDAGEGNVPSPTGVRDLQLHPPENNHNTVAAFKVPQNGTYTISDIGVRRVASSGATARLRVFNAQGTQLTILTATNNQDWVTTPTTFTLSNLTAGQYIYFGVDRDSSFAWDAAEISWTISAIFGSPPPQPTCTLNVNPASIQQGSSTSLSWTTTNATTFSINQGIGAQASVGSGFVTQSPATTTTYTGTATGAGGSVQCSATVTVIPPPTCSLSASPTSITQGNSTTLSWTTTNATAFSINQGIGSVTPVTGGTRTASPGATTIYTGTVTGAGSSAQCLATVTVTALPPPSTCSLSVNPTSIPQGSSSTLSWTTTNATAFSINQSIGSVTPVASGSRSVSPTVTTTYTGTTTGAGGNGSCSATLTVTPAVQLIWNSWDVATQSGSPQAVVTSLSGGVTANVELYESTNNNGITKGSLFGIFTSGAHVEAFNNLTAFWSSLAGASAYPYAGKSTVNRGSDAGETNAPAPLSVRDLQLHPPSNNHNTVAAFRVPQNGTYVVSNIGVRRVSASGNNSRLRVFNAQGTQIASINATNNRQWVTTGALTLSNLTAGQYIYFGVDRNGDFGWDAAEISWTITKN